MYRAADLRTQSWVTSVVLPAVTGTGASAAISIPQVFELSLCWLNKICLWMQEKKIQDAVKSHAGSLMFPGNTIDMFQ